MTMKIAINGFGRIGRLVLRAIIENNADDFNIVAVNDLAEAATLSHLLKYDSIHGRFPAPISLEDNVLQIGDHKIRMLSERNPADLPWAELGVDIVMECTGFFLTKESAKGHIVAGAKKVLFSAPPKDDTKTIVYGINHDIITAEDTIVSNASCTTNALAPIVSLLDDEYGIRSGLMTTIHAYTGDQPTQDSVHKDLYRGRAAAMSMIPTSTGAAKAIGRVLPALDGVLNGIALRVPVPNVSAIDLTVVLKKGTNPEAICKLFKTAAEGSLKGVLGYESDKLVSTDFIHDAHSSTFVEDQVFVQDKTLVRVFSWYDNEWGFSCRMLDTARIMMAAK